MNWNLIKSQLELNYKSSGSEPKFNWKLIKTKLKLN
jgi:hypothetical protein